MTTWNVSLADAIDAKAEGLLCSANPSLNLSGGVGGAFALRFGNQMQEFLHNHLRENDSNFVDPGTAVIAPPCGSPFLAVAHAVAIDAFYDTNQELILRAYNHAIQQLASQGCTTIAAACLGCGYGRVSDSQFAEVARRLHDLHYGTVSCVTLVSTDQSLYETLQTLFDES